MPSQNKRRHQSPKGPTQQPARRHSSWLQRFQRRVSASIGQYIPSRNSRERTSVQNSRGAHAGRHSTPVHSHRPNTAPPNPNSMVFRPIHWELLRKSSRPVSREHKKKCPYDPKMLEFFGNYEASPSTSAFSLGPGWPCHKERRAPTPCNDCLQGTENAHINVSPGRFRKRRSNVQQQSISTHDLTESEPARPMHSVSSRLHDGRPQTAHTPQHMVRISLQTSSTWSLVSPGRPEARKHRVHSDGQATFDRLKAVVESTHGTSSRPRSPPPRLHRLSPEISFIHRSEVNVHQTAIREGYQSPILQHQARGMSDISVIGYTIPLDDRDSSSTALYSETTVPGRYLPLSPNPIPPPQRTFSPVHRRSIDLSPVQRPAVFSTLHEPPFVPALPPGTQLRPVSEWGRSHSAPGPRWEEVLRHSAVYRARDVAHIPRSPSPLREQHGPTSFNSERSHGTMPRSEVRSRNGMVESRINGTGKGPNIRGGGEESLEQGGLRRGKSRHWDEWNGCRASDVEEDDGGHRDYDTPQSYLQRRIDRLDVIVQLTAQIPHLRGGGGEPSRVPASLLYLAGSTRRKPGKSISTAEWNSMKPKRRMGGLLGMAVYGSKAGKHYIPERRDQDVQTGADLTAADVGAG